MIVLLSPENCLSLPLSSQVSRIILVRYELWLLKYSVILLVIMGTFELEVVTHIYVKTTFCDDKTPPSLIPRTLDREGFALCIPDIY